MRKRRPLDALLPKTRQGILVATFKRNVSEYEFAGGISETDAEGLLEAVRKFAKEAEAWIKANHPSLA